MNTSTNIHRTGLLAALALGGPAIASNLYVITDLGTLGGPGVGQAPGAEARALGGGLVVGDSVLGDLDPPLRAFLWDAGTMIELAPLAGDPHSDAFGVNGAGDAVGVSYALGEVEARGVLWASGGPPVSIGPFTPLDINDAGLVVGEMPVDAVSGHAVTWQAGVLTDLGTLGGTHSSARAVNAAGRIVGASMLANDSGIRAALWQGGPPIDLGTLGGATSQAFDINGAGQVVGVADTPLGAPHAFLFQLDDAGAVTLRTDLGAFGPGSYAYAINEAGAVAGTSDSRAVLWEGGGGPVDLNERLGPGAAWSLASATDIDDAGRIVGTGMHLGRPRAYLLTPAAPGDVNADGEVDVDDLVAVIVAWGPCPPAPCPADANGDGEVDVNDLVLVIVNWS